MNLISVIELKTKIDSGQSFKLLMVYNDDRFREGHIPGSICCPTAEKALDMLKDLSETIVVYCTHEACNNSRNMYANLNLAGYTNVMRFAGGLQGWLEAGHVLDKGVGSTSH